MNNQERKGIDPEKEFPEESIDHFNSNSSASINKNKQHTKKSKGFPELESKVNFDCLGEKSLRRVVNMKFRRLF